MAHVGFNLPETRIATWFSRGEKLGPFQHRSDRNDSSDSVIQHCPVGTTFYGEKALEF